MKIWQRIYCKILAAFGIVVVWLQAGTCLFLPYHDAEPQNNTIFAGLFRYKNKVQDNFRGFFLKFFNSKLNKFSCR